MNVKPVEGYMLVRSASEKDERNIWEILDPGDVDGAEGGGFIMALESTVFPIKVHQQVITLGLVHVSEVLAIVEPD